LLKVIIAGLDPAIFFKGRKRMPGTSPGMMNVRDDPTPAPQVAHVPKMQQASHKGH
jgi:hypothetical protein